MLVVKSWPKSFPHPALVFVVIAWGFNFAVIKIAYHDFSPAALALIRFLGMWPVLLVATRMLGGTFRYPEGRDKGRIIWAGFLASGLYMVLFLEGMQRSGAAQGAITLATAPIFIGLFSVIAKQEAFRWQLLLGSLIAFAGVAIVVVAGNGKIEGTLFGSLLVLASAIVWAWSVIVMRPLLERGEPVSVLALSFPGAAIALIPYGLMPLIETKWASVSPAGWAALAYLILVAGVLAFIAYYRGIAEVGPNKTSMTQFFIPPTAAIGAWILLGQPVTLGQGIGLAVVILGVYLGSRKLKGRIASTAPESGLAPITPTPP